MSRSTAFLEAAGEAWLLHTALRVLAILAIVIFTLGAAWALAMGSAPSNVDTTAAISRIGHEPPSDLAVVLDVVCLIAIAILLIWAWRKR